MSALHDLPPHVQHLASGTWRLDVRAPRNRPPQVNVYILEHAAGLVLVDTGWDDESHDDLMLGLASLGAGAADITGIVLTHGHPDHSGLAARLQRESDCWVGIHALDRRWFSGDSGAALRLDASDAGIPTDQLAKAQQAFGGAPVVEPPELTDLEHGAMIPLAGRPLRAIWTPGHTPGHLCLLDEGRFLFTGDHALPDFPPIVHVGAWGERSAYSAYLDSLARTRGLAPVHLPGHGGLLGEPEIRLAEIAEDVTRRLDDVALTLATIGDSTAWEVASRLPSRRPWADTSAPRRVHAATDIHQRLVHLEECGRVARTGSPSRWRPADASQHSAAEEGPAVEVDHLTGDECPQVT